MERWKEIEGYELYEVSDRGQVRSWNGNTGHGPRRRKRARLLKLPPDGAGYPQVSLCKNGECKTCRVHTLVLTTFATHPCLVGLECCHEDGDRTNNHLSNLRWDTHSSNVLDAVRHGTHVPSMRRGEAHNSSKLTKVEVIKIREIYAAGDVTQTELGERFNIGRTQVGYIIHHKSWAHIP